MTFRLIPGVLLVSTLALGPAASASSLPVTTNTVAAYRATIGASRVTARRTKNTKLVPTRTTRRARVRRIFWNPLLRGSHESQLRQNEEIDQLGLPRIEDDAQLQELVEREELVPLYDTKFLRIAPNLNEDRRLCRAVTRDFLDDLSRAFYQQFHDKIQVNSAVRTVEQQRVLRRHNANAAPETGETASSHLSGLTVDLNKRGMSRKQHAWLERYLADLKAQNLIEPLEERRQPVFHVMVFERYNPQAQQAKVKTDTPAEADPNDSPRW